MQSYLIPYVCYLWEKFNLMCSFSFATVDHHMFLNLFAFSYDIFNFSYGSRISLLWSVAIACMLLKMYVTRSFSYGWWGNDCYIFLKGLFATTCIHFIFNFGSCVLLLFPFLKRNLITIMYTLCLCRGCVLIILLQKKRVVFVRYKSSWAYRHYS